MGGSSALQCFAEHWYNYCLTGREKELCQLYDMISLRDHQNCTRVVTVWGSPGFGTYEVVAKVYSHYVLTDRSPFQLYGWVDMYSNPNPLNLEGFFSLSLLSYMRPQLKDADPNSNHGLTVEDDCINLLTNNRCLVVIDGLQSVEDCQKLIDARLIYGHRNSCVILITEEESVATFWEGTTPHAVCYIKPLNDQQVCMHVYFLVEETILILHLSLLWFSRMH